MNWWLQVLTRTRKWKSTNCRDIWLKCRLGMRLLKIGLTKPLKKMSACVPTYSTFVSSIQIWSKTINWNPLACHPPANKRRARIQRWEKNWNKRAKVSTSLPKTKLTSRGNGNWLWRPICKTSRPGNSQESRKALKQSIEKRWSNSKRSVRCRSVRSFRMLRTPFVSSMKLSLLIYAVRWSRSKTTKKSLISNWRTTVRNTSRKCRGFMKIRNCCVSSLIRLRLSMGSCRVSWWWRRISCRRKSYRRIMRFAAFRNELQGPSRKVRKNYTHNWER